jgi:hypothetical protein
MKKLLMISTICIAVIFSYVHMTESKKITVQYEYDSLN